jgi:hypothetical protein
MKSVVDDSAADAVLGRKRLRDRPMTTAEVEVPSERLGRPGGARRSVCVGAVARPASERDR